MADPILTPGDLEAFATIDPAKARDMIADVEAMAALAAPCINDPDFRADPTLMAAAKAIVRQAVLRRNEAGTGAITQVGAGSFQMSTDTRAPLRGLLWPSEIVQLRELCATFAGDLQDQAFTVSMIPETPTDPLASRPDLWFQNVHPTPPGAP